MASIEEAKEILLHLGLDSRYCNDRSARTLIALANVIADQSWEEATREPYTIHNIIAQISKILEHQYAENSRETIRKQRLTPLREWGIVEKKEHDPSRATNSPASNYRLSEEALEIIRMYGNGVDISNLRYDGTDIIEPQMDFRNNAAVFRTRYIMILEKTARQRDEHRVETMLPNGRVIILSSGAHNVLQREILEDYCEKHVTDPHVLYVGDTRDRELILEREQLEELGINVSDKTLIPDVIIIDRATMVLHVVEAYHSTGQFDNLRLGQVQEMFSECQLVIRFVTAVAEMKSVGKIGRHTAWGTSIWVSEYPNELIIFTHDGSIDPISMEGVESRVDSMDPDDHGVDFDAVYDPEDPMGGIS